MVKFEIYLRCFIRTLEYPLPSAGPMGPRIRGAREGAAYASDKCLKVGASRCYVSLCIPYWALSPATPHEFHIGTTQLSREEFNCCSPTLGPSAMRGTSSPIPIGTPRKRVRSMLTVPVRPTLGRIRAWSPGPSPHPSPGWIPISLSSPFPIVARGTQGTPGPNLGGWLFAHTRARRLPGNFLDVHFFRVYFFRFYSPCAARAVDAECDAFGDPLLQQYIAVFEFLTFTYLRLLVGTKSALLNSAFVPPFHVPAPTRARAEFPHCGPFHVRFARFKAACCPWWSW